MYIKMKQAYLSEGRTHTLGKSYGVTDKEE